MVTRRLLLVAAGVVATVAAIGCSCLEVKTGTATVRTDCLGSPEDHTFMFVIVPQVGEIDEVLQALPAEVRELVACPAQQEESLECKPIGYGVAEDSSATVAILCDRELRVTGPAQVDQNTQVFFHCVAPLPFGEENLWLMGCDYVDVLGEPVDGPRGRSCRSVTTMDIQFSSSDLIPL